METASLAASAHVSTGARDGAGRLPLDALTGIRFLAALDVVLYHLEYRSTTSAVTFFFVLSGFLLTCVYLPRDGPATDARRFWIARFSRLYPTHLLALLLLLVIALALGADLTRQAASGVASVFVVQAWNPRLVFGWNTPAWTISVEAFFILVFPALAALVAPTRGKAALAVWMGGLWLLGMAFSWAYLQQAGDPRLADLDPWYNFVKYAPIVRLPEFFLGIVLARWFVLHGGPRRPDLAAAAGLAVLVAAAVAWERIPHVLMHNALLAPACGLVVLGLVSGGAAGRLFQTPVLMRLGQLSFALFILQEPVAQAWFALRGERVWRPETLGSALGFLVVLGLAALVVHRHFELPMREALRRALRPGPTRHPLRWALGGAVVMLLAVAVTAELPQRNGSSLASLHRTVASLGAEEVAWDLAFHDLPRLITYREALPGVRFRTFDSAAGEAPPAPLVIGGRNWPQAEALGARYVDGEPGMDQALWSLPGHPLRLTVDPHLTLGATAVPGVWEDGFQGPEHLDPTTPVRWTNGHATLQVPLSPGTRLRGVRLRLGAMGQAQRLDVKIDGRSAWSGPPKEDIRLSLPVRPDRLSVRIEILSDPWVPREVDPRSSDSRVLGVQVLGIELLQ